MWPKTTCHRLFHLMLCLSSVLFLASCAGTKTTADGNAPGESLLLEDMGNGVCHQGSSRLMWQIQKSQKFSTWDEANEYANSLQLGGFDDWRLPTKEETLFLSELLLLNNGNCPITFKRAHWVNSKDKGTAGFWEDYPLCGGSEFLWVEGKKGSVRAVRP
ncbi:MAG: DUF1566 domain-containing protein [Desulfocapsa sp.]|nr:DUF1566 domain-containing protein [Desulfocapsa sp.]